MVTIRNEPGDISRSQIMKSLIYIKDDLIFYCLVWDPYERVKGENLLLLLIIILGQQQALTGTLPD